MKNLFLFLAILGLTLSVNSFSYSQDFGPARTNSQSQIIPDLTGDFNPMLISGQEFYSNFETDVVNGAWTTLAASVKTQSRSCCVYLNLAGTEYIYQFGGGAGAQLTSIARYNIATNTWALLGQILNLAASSATAINDGDSVIYIFGGNNPTTAAQKFNVITGITTTLAPMPNRITDAAVVKYRDSLIYIIGGGTGLFGAGYVANTDVYNKNTNTYAAATAYPIAAGMQGVGIDGNQIVVAGGWTGATGTPNAYLGTIDPSNHLIIAWTVLPNYPGGGVTRTASYFMQQEDASASGPNSRGVMFTGGALNGATLQNRTFFYNLTCSLWDSTATLPVARSNMKGAGRGDSVMWVVAGFTTVGVGNTDRLTVSSIVCGAPTVDNYAIDNIYALGKVPTPWGCPDTICYRLRKLLPNPNPIQIRVKIINLAPNPGNVKLDTFYIITPSHPNPFDSLIAYVRPWNINNWKKDSIVIQAVPKTGETVVSNNYKSWRQMVTCNAWNWADPMAPPDGGVGFNGGVGGFVSCFRNTCPIPVPLWAVDLCFNAFTGGGNQRYRVVIFGQGGTAAPGPLVYRSGYYRSPPGITGTPQRIQITLPNVPIAPNSRFYVGVEQDSLANLSVCYQSENPVKTGRFFFNVDTNYVGAWTDFGPTTAPFRLDICPLTTANVHLGAWMEGFYNGTSMVSDTTYLDLRQATTPYALIETSTSVLQSNGTGIYPFCRVQCDTPYWYALRHRNHIQTWTSGAFVYDCESSYDLRGAACAAFGCNQVFVPADAAGGGFAIYTGDVQQDCIVDGSDCSLVDNDAFNFVSGYVDTDLNGDQIVDGTDGAYCDNNAFNFIGCILP